MVADNQLPQSLFFMKFLNNLTKGRCYVHFTLEGCADYGGWIATQKNSSYNILIIRIVTKAFV